ncbi:DUF423 domain-containing protein [Limibacillus halophilus]|uniref:Uncharacterized membrane protein YgdD (TMEM256/DUF423 family) n=1 Tax=Limibacillus halophilus TaxID=1579333 RepID=A0A839SS17_9PROT|nr:DUF423 domain-containing protein [Limibacillus halophilus]MBB3065108.1 uncharacterized membrane protein YgdD (TMEM256/DUF423 family) [Limibacillus halophilus]
MQRQSETAKGSGFLIAGAVFGFLGVASGAFAAHALRGSLTSEAMDWLATASQYWLVHAAVLVALAALLSGPQRQVGRLLLFSGWGMVAGGLAFSGSLAVLAIGGPHFLVWVTPLGGSLLLLSWLSLAGAGLMRLRN